MNSERTKGNQNWTSSIDRILFIPGAIAGPLVGCFLLLCSAFSVVWHRKWISNTFNCCGTKTRNKVNLKPPIRHTGVEDQKEEEVISLTSISLTTNPPSCSNQAEDHVKQDAKEDAKNSAAEGGNLDTMAGESHSTCFAFCSLNTNFDVVPAQCFCQLVISCAPTTRQNLELVV